MPTWFSLLTLFDGDRNALKRGEYEFRAGDSIRQVEAKLISGKVVLHPLTIPEGLTSEQVVQRVRDAEYLSGDVKEVPREGSLLPETYDFPRGFSRQAALARMGKAQAKVVDDIWKRRAPDLPIRSPGEMVTLASIVEKETGKADERPRVAGVFVNRLQKHMRLEFDPTIVYGLVFGKGTLGHSITKAEVNQPTPYNTYIIEGLPPGPISNPGKAALEAVANPVRSKDLYFVADGSGGHVFADSFEQHLKNVARWRQFEKDAKDRLAPDVTPPPASAIHGSLDDVDPASFGALTAPGVSHPTSAAILARLAKIGARRKALEFGHGVAFVGWRRTQVDRRTRGRCRGRERRPGGRRRVRLRGFERHGLWRRRLRSAFSRDAGGPEGARGEVRNSRGARERGSIRHALAAASLRPSADL